MTRDKATAHLLWNSQMVAFKTFTIPASEVTKNQRNLYRSAYAEVDEQVSSLPAGGYLN